MVELLVKPERAGEFYISFYKKKAINLKQQLDKPVLGSTCTSCKLFIRNYNRSYINNKQLPENLLVPLPLSLVMFLLATENKAILLIHTLE